MNTEQQIEIVKANGEGKQLERASSYRCPLLWSDSPIRDHLNFSEYVYRIKEQPQSIDVEIWSTEGVLRAIEASSSASRIDLFNRGWIFIKTVNIEV